MYNSVIFTIFTELCNYSHSLILEKSCHSKKNPQTDWQPLPISPRSLPVPGNHVLSPRICQFWTFLRNGIIYTICGFL